MRDKQIIEYPKIQVEPGLSGSPIFFWGKIAYGQVGIIVGVHTGSNANQNFGTFFGDDFGLIQIFGLKKFEDFIVSLPSYEPKTKVIAFAKQWLV